MMLGQIQKWTERFEHTFMRIVAKRKISWLCLVIIRLGEQWVNSLRCVSFRRINSRITSMATDQLVGHYLHHYLKSNFEE